MKQPRTHGGKDSLLSYPPNVILG